MNISWVKPRTFLTNWPIDVVPSSQATDAHNQPPNLISFSEGVADTPPAKAYISPYVDLASSRFFSPSFVCIKWFVLK